MPKKKAAKGGAVTFLPKITLVPGSSVTATLHGHDDDDDELWLEVGGPGGDRPPQRLGPQRPAEGTVFLPQSGTYTVSFTNGTSALGSGEITVE